MNRPQHLSASDGSAIGQRRDVCVRTATKSRRNSAQEERAATLHHQRKCAAGR